MVYFIRMGNKFIKIGCSDRPSFRLQELQTASPLKLHLQAVIEGNFQTEKGLHEMFSHLKTNGEWFRYTDELKFFIRMAKNLPNQNIKTIYNESQKFRIKSKSKRLGKKHKISKRLEKYGA